MLKDTISHDFWQSQKSGYLNLCCSTIKDSSWQERIDFCNGIKICIDRLSVDQSFLIDIGFRSRNANKPLEIHIESSFWHRAQYCDIQFYSRNLQNANDCHFISETETYDITFSEVLESHKLCQGIMFLQKMKHVGVFIYKWGQDEFLPGYVYVINALGTNRIKIGYSENPQKRLQQLSTGSSFPLELWGAIPASPPDERRLHSRFSEYRVNGEWFNLDGPVFHWAMNVKGQFQK